MKVLILLGVLVSSGLCIKIAIDDDDDEYIGNPDDFAEIQRPCQVYDLYCIRKFFASHAKCTITMGPLTEPLQRTTVDPLYISHSNMTVIAPMQSVYGLLTSRIEEFYVNKATNNLVIAINVRDFLQIGPNLYYLYNRRAREPIVGNAPAFVAYQSLTFTVVIPNIKDLQLDRAEVTGYVDDAFPPFGVGPGTLPPGADATAVAEFAEFAANPSLNVRELMLTDSQYYPLFYIQNNLCDFGLKVL